MALIIASIMDRCGLDGKRKDAGELWPSEPIGNTMARLDRPSFSNVGLRRNPTIARERPMDPRLKPKGDDQRGGLRKQQDVGQENGAKERGRSCGPFPYSD
jgi:hypothetical protein